MFNKGQLNEAEPLGVISFCVRIRGWRASSRHTGFEIWSTANTESLSEDVCLCLWIVLKSKNLTACSFQVWMFLLHVFFDRRFRRWKRLSWPHFLFHWNRVFRSPKKKTRWWSRSSTGCWRPPPTWATSSTLTSSTTNPCLWARPWRWSYSKLENLGEI